MHASKLLRRRHGIGKASITAGFRDVVVVFGAVGAAILFIGEKHTNELRADSQKLEAKMESIGSDIRDALAVMHTR